MSHNGISRGLEGLCIKTYYNLLHTTHEVNVKHDFVHGVFMEFPFN